MTSGCALLSSLLLVVSCHAVHHTGDRDGDSSPLHPLSDEFIAKVNEKASSWKAGRNFAAGLNMDYVKGLMGVSSEFVEEMKQFSGREGLPIRSQGKVEELLKANSDILETFDARITWPHCPSLREIRDQGGCGSCWAISTVESMTDRQCILKNETFHYSAEDMLACCKDCGKGCRGGSPYRAIKYWSDTGVVSGGPYGSKEGCKPYTIEPCGHHSDDTYHKCANHKTPHCRKRCDRSYDFTYGQDEHEAYGTSVITGDRLIREEIVNNGPIVSWFTVYEDFLHYKSGVYVHKTGDKLGGHAVKLLGFGVEDGIPFYLCANSWGDDWGENGFFKINRADMEQVAVFGFPA